MDKLILKNFKVFKEETSLELAPITILTGKNSSGKSSIMKALLLLADYLQNNDNQLVLPLNKQFSEKHRINEWGNAHNWFSEDKTLTLGYEQDGHAFHFAFSSDSDDSIAGELQSTSIKNADSSLGLSFVRRSKEEYDLHVSGEFIDQLINNSRIQSPSDLLVKREKMQLRLNSVRKQKAESTKTELQLIEEEQKLESQLKLLNEQVRSMSQEKTSDITTHIDLSERNVLFNTSFGGLVRYGLHHHFVNSDIERGTKPTPSPIPFRFTDSLNRASQFGISHLSPNRTKQARLFTKYDSSTSEFQELINWFAAKYFAKSNRLSRFMEYWMRELGIGESLHVKNVEGEAATVKVRIAGKQKPVDLADLGYGCGQVLTILLSILKLASETSFSIGTRMLPRRKNRLLLIEEAESNLHPNLQSKLAELFVEAHKEFGIQFILESHSEYLIRKLQVMVATEKISKDDSIVYYMEDGGDVKPLRFLQNGKLDGEFGRGFIDESSRSMIELLSYKNI